MFRMGVVILSLFSLPCLAQKKNKMTVSYDVDRTRIAIFNMPTDGSGTPFPNAVPTELTHDDLTVVEELLQKAVKDYNEELAKEFDPKRLAYDGSRTKLKDWTLDLAKYKRQYMPMVNAHGEKEVWISCLCEKEIYDDYWQTHLLVIPDGGCCYFKLMVNITANKYYLFSINGD